jgi:hypothetical protein
MADCQTSPTLPVWIPCGAGGPYRAVYANGGYSDKRHADALEALFHSDALQTVWEGNLGKLLLSADGWSYLVASLILSVECAPPNGKRATADRPDKKKRIHAKQDGVDRLLAAAAEKARELSELLCELEENGGDFPAEACSGMALIESAIGADGMSRACYAEPFESFRHGLSSYADGYFPHPIAIINRLAQSFEDHPRRGELFANDPWLSSNQSSWKDYVRVVKARLVDCKRMYYSAPDFTDADWHGLCNVLLNLPDLTRQTVSKGLKEL